MIQQVILVDCRNNTNKTSLKRLAQVLNIQLCRDFGPAWEIEAKVSVAEWYWPIKKFWSKAWELRIMDRSDVAAAHGTENGRPYAAIVGVTSLDASHELLELLANPYIDIPGFERTLSGPSPVPQQGIVRFRVEPVDPVDGDGYELAGMLVSNFCLPQFYTSRAGERPFDFLDHLARPREPLGPNSVLEWWIGEPPILWYRHWDPQTNSFRNELRGSSQS